MIPGRTREKVKTMASKLKQSLLDFQAEMKGHLLSDTFTVQDKTWTMKLLNDEEQTWAMSMVNTTNIISTGLSGRLANLAIGIREIDGIPVYEYFVEDWEKLPEADRDALENMNQFALKYFVSEHLHSVLADMPPDFITELWEAWEKLGARRAASQEMSKKSSGETSTTESNES